MDSKRLRGLPVVVIEGGLKLSTINDVAIDPNRREIVAFDIRQGGGLLSGVVDPPLIVDADRVHSLGNDALMLHSASVVREGIRGGRADALPLDSLLP